ncbi:MAG: acetylserotonin O-methyltransferase [Gallionella sp.]|nr:acetylserotonin O-methyltransferase [Gallionella sp.]
MMEATAISASTTTIPSPTPDHIMQIGMGFWASKTLLSAIEMGIFTDLAKHPEDIKTLRDRFNLHERSARDFLDALVAMGMLQRRDNKYHNTPQTNVFLDKDKPSYIGGMLEMANNRLYGFWGNLTEALRTGEQQNEAKVGEDPFAAIYAHPAILKEFLAAMTGVSHGANLNIAAKFPWENYKTFVDVGTAQGDLAVQIASAQEHLQGIGFDLPVVEPIFEEYAQSNGLASRLSFVGGNFFEDSIPKADVVLMGHVLHDWNIDEKKTLIKKAYDALPEGGALVVYESLIDDDRSQNLFGLLMSLNMLIETHGGFDFTGADCSGWMKEAGFKEMRVEHLVGPDSMVIGIK